MGAGPTPNLDSLENRIPLGLIITKYWLCFCVVSVLFLLNLTVKNHN